MPNKLTQIRDRLSPGLRKVIRNVGWLSMEKVLAMLLNLTVGIYVIRYLGADDFGKLSFCLSLVGMFVAIAKLGLDAIVVRSLVQDEDSASEILGTALVLKLMGSAIALVVITSVVLALDESSQVFWLTVLIACKLVFSSFEVIDFWFQSIVFSRAIVMVKTVKLIASSVAKLLLIFYSFGLFAFAWLLLVEEIFQAVGTVWVYIRYNLLPTAGNKNLQAHSNRLSILHWKFDSLRAKTMLTDSWPLILSAVMITIYMKIDQVMLGSMTDKQTVGNYAAAIKFSEVWYFVPTAICASVFPTIIRAKQKGKQSYYKKLQQLYDLMAWMSIPLAVVMTFFSGTLTSKLLGAGYTEAGNILAWHIWAGPFVFLGVARNQWLMAENLTKLSFATNSLGAIVNVLLNFWLIPIYGGTGAAIATVISYIVASYFTCMIYPKMFDTAWMLTKALLIPLRIHQNFIYLNYVKKFFS